MRAVDLASEAGATLLITCDCGVSNAAEIAAARDRGIDTVVIDHHRAPPVLPPATAVINPHQPGCSFEFKGLCAAGLAFYLCAGVRQRLRALEWPSERLPDLRPLLDVVTLGTIADVVPLAEENRALVRHGLGLIAAGGRPGIRALKRVAAVPAGPVTASTVAFRLVPRLNAAGRVGDAERAVRLLVTGDEEDAQRLALELDQENERRRAIEAANLEEAVADALAMAGPQHAAGLPAALVLASDRWHHGVVGIVAARLVDRFAVPAAVIALKDGAGRGSVRSPRGFHVYDALVESGSHLVRYGGHAAAGGFSIVAGRIDGFRAAFVQAAESQLEGRRREIELSVDAEVVLGEVDLALCRELESLGPFGEGNPEPLLVVRGARVAAERLLREKHWRGQIDDGTGRRRAIGFGLGSRYPLAGPEDGEGPAPRLDFAFHAETNEWRGLTEVSLRVRDVRPCGHEAGARRDPRSRGEPA
jgi:single-stranded-DNA-specific exonuclease